MNLSAKSDANSQVFVPDNTGAGMVGNADYKAFYTSSGALECDERRKLVLQLPRAG